MNIPVEEVIKVSPLNSIGYGFAVLVLTSVAVIFYKKWLEERDYNKEIELKFETFMATTIELLVKVEQRLNDQQKFGDILTKIQNEIKRNNAKN